MMVVMLGSIWDPLMRFLERGRLLLPVLLAIVIVLAAGLIAAWLAETLLRWVLRRLGFDRIAHRPQVTDSLRRAGLRRQPSELVGHLARWLIVILTLLGALSILSSEATDVVLGAMVTYVPRLVAGLLLVVVGYAVSTFARTGSPFASLVHRFLPSRDWLWRIRALAASRIVPCER